MKFNFKFSRTYKMINDSNTSSISTARNTWQVVSAVLFLFVTILVALIGNIAVMFVIRMNSTFRREVANMLIINLSINDLLNTLLVMLSALVSMLTDTWQFGTMWCDMVCAINYCLIIVSMLTLCFISIDRYQAVVHPLQYQYRVTRSRISIAIIYAWCQGILFASIPALLNWVEYDYWEAICAIQWHTERTQAIYYVVSAFTFCFLVPGIILIHCYTKILAEVKRQRMCVGANPTNTPGVYKRQQGAKMRMVWSLLIVVFAYFVCMTPFSVTKLIKVSTDDEDIISNQVNMMSALLGYFASAINPLIYGIFRKDFRRAYIRLVKSLFLQKQKVRIDDQNNLQRISVI